MDDDITNQLSELLGVHCNIAVSVFGVFELFLGQDTNVDGDGGGCEKVVTRDDAEVDVALLGVGNHVLHVLSQRVLQSNQGKESLVGLEGADLIFSVDVTLHSVHDTTKLANGHVGVGEGNGAEGVDSHSVLLVLAQDVLLLNVVQGHLARLLVHLTIRALRLLALVLVAAVVDNNLWSTLDVDTDSVLQLVVAHSNDRSLQLRVEWHLSQHVALLDCHVLVNWDFSRLEPLDEGDFSAVAHWHVE